jgi:hypothetical protein
VALTRIPARAGPSGRHNPAMTTGDGGATYTADMDRSASPEQVAEVQQLFDEIGLSVRVSASYLVKSAAGDIEAVLWLVGSGVAAAFLAAAGSFGKKLGGGLGDYAAKRVTDWFEQLRRARERKMTTVIQDRAIAVEIIIAGDEPPEAFSQLKELLDNDGIKEIPGKSAAIRWTEVSGWVRPF